VEEIAGAGAGAVVEEGIGAVAEAEGGDRPEGAEEAGGEGKSCLYSA
jgi:hypothetical protein